MEHAIEFYVSHQYILAVVYCANTYLYCNVNTAFSFSNVTSQISSMFYFLFISNALLCFITTQSVSVLYRSFLILSL